MLRLTAAMCLAVALFACVATAQDQAPAKTFDLKHARFDTTGTSAAPAEQAAPVRRPRLEPGTLGVGVTLGYLDLSGTLLEHSQIIYKVTEEFVYWGDVRLKGTSAFNPVLRLDYQLKPWLAIEGAFGLSVSEYTSEVGQRVATAVDPLSDVVIENPELGEFDIEQRSLITLNTNVAGVVYPLDLLHARDGEAWSSRWHPFVLLGGGRTWFSLNSDYTDQTAASLAFCAGGGIRVIADDLVSLRLEVLYNHATIDLEPADSFQEFNDGTVVVPVMERRRGEAPSRVTEYSNQTLGSLSWGFGFTAAF